MKSECGYEEVDELAAIRVAKNHNLERDDDLDVEVYSWGQNELKDDNDVDIKSNSDNAPNIGNYVPAFLQSSAIDTLPDLFILIAPMFWLAT